MTLDIIKGAYLNAKMKEKVYMKLPREELTRLIFSYQCLVVRDFESLLVSF